MSSTHLCDEHSLEWSVFTEAWGRGRCFAMKQEVVITRTYTQRHLLGTASQPYVTNIIRFTLNLHCVISSKFFMHDNSLALNTSICQNSLIHIAPPTGNSNSALCEKCHPIYKQFTWCGLQMIYSNMTSL